MLTLADARRRARSTTSCCSAWAARRSRPRCCGGRSAASASTSSTRRTPRRSARSQSQLDLERTLFVSASKSGATLETRSHTDYFWKLAPRGGSGSRSPIPARSSRRSRASASFRAIFPGEPTIGGRYSALSPFGLVPAALLGVDLRRLLERAVEMAEACRLAEGNPGLELGLSLGEGWEAGRDKVCVAEPARLRPLGRAAGRRVDRQGGQGPRARARRVARRARPAGAGGPRSRRRTSSARSSSAGSSPSRSPARSSASTRSTSRTCRRRRTRRTRCSRPATSSSSREGSLDELLAPAQRRRLRLHPGVRQPDRRRRRGDSRALADARARGTGCVVTHGFGPRYLHSTGQLHKGGPNNGVFLQVVDDTGEELTIPGQPFGFGAADPRAGRRRLRVAARARPPRRARAHGGSLTCSSG